MCSLGHQTDQVSKSGVEVFRRLVLQFLQHASTVLRKTLVSTGWNAVVLEVGSALPYIAPKCESCTCSQCSQPVGDGSQHDLMPSPLEHCGKPADPSMQKISSDTAFNKANLAKNIQM